MVVTKAPSEPWSVVKKTLKAILLQTPAHDTWLADENPQPQTIAWCKTHAVQISSRKNIPEYHRTSWPRRTKCKEGNLAYFYDHYGYKKYDFVVQMDADHVPQPGYLLAMLAPFLNKKVGYVSAPSICSANAKRSWAARGRLYAEAYLHGFLQAGYNGGWNPLCIGSHYAVRTKALQKIGGLGPELAEDHSTTMMMAADGWQGVHAIDALAYGEGPNTFSDCMTQEYQWSRSLTVLLLTLTPKYWPQLTNRQKFQFLFSQFWYPIFSLSMFFAFFIPAAALLTKTPWVNTAYLEFIAYASPVTLSTLLIVYWVKRQKLLRPANAKILSWELFVFQITRWPWVLLGVIDGVRSAVKKQTFNFKITPKGRSIYPLSRVSLIPYCLIVSVNACIAVFVNNPGQARGYYYFALINSFMYLLVIGLIIFKHYHDQKINPFTTK